MSPEQGPLLDSGGVCSIGPYVVYGTESVCVEVQIRGLYCGDHTLKHRLVGSGECNYVFLEERMI